MLGNGHKRSRQKEGKEGWRSTGQATQMTFIDVKVVFSFVIYVSGCKIHPHQGLFIHQLHSVLY